MVWDVIMVVIVDSMMSGSSFYLGVSRKNGFLIVFGFWISSVFCLKQFSMSDGIMSLYVVYWIGLVLKWFMFVQSVFVLVSISMIELSMMQVCSRWLVMNDVV